MSEIRYVSFLTMQEMALVKGFLFDGIDQATTGPHKQDTTVMRRALRKLENAPPITKHHVFNFNEVMEDTLHDELKGINMLGDQETIDDTDIGWRSMLLAFEYTGEER